MTGKDLIRKLNSLPEEERELPVVITYYDDPDSSVPVGDKIGSVDVYDNCYPFGFKCIHLGT